LSVSKKESDSFAQAYLTDASLNRLVFAAQKYKAFWTEKRKQMVKDREQDRDAADKFIDEVFNNLDFWVDLQNDWKKSGLSSTQPTSSVTTTNDGEDNENKLVVVVFDEARGLLDDEDPDNSLFLALRRSLADAYKTPSLYIHMFGVLMDTSSKTANFSPSRENDPSARAFHGSKLFDPYLLPGTKDVRYDDKQDWS
jgi:hypothetical protein